MNIFGKLLVPTLSCLLLGIAYAEKWEFLGDHKLGKMYLDSASVKKTGTKVQYWVKREFFKDQRSDMDKFTYDEQHMLHNVDCAKKTVSFQGMRFYNNDKKITETTKMKHGPVPIKPGGFVIREYDKLCTNGEKLVGW